jgi:hypothetical protein
MNFGKTVYSHKPGINYFNLSNQNNKIKISADAFRKLIPSYSCSNYFSKSKKKSLFLRTLNKNKSQIINSIKEHNLLLKKIKLKKSTSSIFQSNDVDLVRNLNLDSKVQYIDNAQLRENLMSSLKNNESEANDNNNNEKKENDEVQLPTLSKLAKYKSYEIILSHKKKIKIEMSEQLQKELLMKLKLYQSECRMKKYEKDKIFEKIKKMEEELEEIDAENHYFKEVYKKQISDIIKKRKESSKKRLEVIKSRFNMDKKKKKVHLGSLMDIFNVNRKNNYKIKPKYNSISDVPNKNNENKEEENDKKLMDDNNQELDTSNLMKEEKRPQEKKLENFEINMLQNQKKKEYENFQKTQEEKIKTIKEDIKKFNVVLNKINLELEEIKKKEKKITNRLMTFYKELLYKGKNVKKDGLVWIIKAMWNLGENVPMSFMPEFLDFDSIDYLFKLAHKQLEIEMCHKRIKEIKLNLKNKIGYKYSNIKLKTNVDNTSKDFNESNILPSTVKEKIIYMKNESEKMEKENKKDIYKELTKEFKEKNLQFEIINLPEVSHIDKIRKYIEQIESDIIELKQKEIQRIYRCFIEFDYENKYHTNIETVLSALIGIDAKDTEMNKFNTIKKDYITSLKKIRFFDHEHIRKILSK